MEVSKQVDTGGENVLDEIKLRREIERSKEINALKNLRDEKADEDSRKLIDKKISEIVDNTNKEMICENVFSSKGIGDCTVLFSGDIVYVITQKKLSKQQVIQIQSTVMNVFRVKIDRIRITSSSQ
ncbi:SpoIIIAH-like family protein [Caldicellulosiruptor naganoensis]|uniref:SpoIIIAH-like family protein n=1 Tax=Caldicellulosiruptor naganoensis TaxID=29324 RepID=UPI0027D8169C|nr:SpoIIIAH-like family protein [Caldicellulosiruptor naganoensis]